MKNVIRKFPETITVTDQVLDITSYSTEWKQKVSVFAEKILKEYSKSKQKRFIVAFGGPSGSGKSTTAAIIEYLLNHAEENQRASRILTVSQDAYHFPQKFLAENVDEVGEPLSNHKGRYDTYDVAQIKNDLEKFKDGETVAFPSYSRKIHDPVLNSILCAEENAILIFEGLWLLYNQKPWNNLLPLYDMSVFFEVSEDLRKQHTISRHVRGGREISDAEKFYNESDMKNTQLMLSSVSPYDQTFSFN